METVKPCRQCGWPYEVGSDGLCSSCRKLKNNPDGLSKRTHLGKIPFRDFKQLDEPERIAAIVGYLRGNRGKDILVMVDVGDGYADKGDRYIKAIRREIEEVKVIKRSPGPVAGVESIVFRL